MPPLLASRRPAASAAWLNRAWPNIVVGLAIALVAARGGIEILLDARRTRG